MPPVLVLPYATLSFAFFAPLREAQAFPLARSLHSLKPHFCFARRRDWWNSPRYPLKTTRNLLNQLEILCGLATGFPYLAPTLDLAGVHASVILNQRLFLQGGKR
jgi:hypothetical protein